MMQILITSTIVVSFYLGGSFAQWQNCSNKCSQKDETLEACWLPTLQYYQENFVQTMEYYMAVMVDINQWYWRHGVDKRYYVNDSDVRGNATILMNYVQDPKLVTQQLLLDVLHPIFNQTYEFSSVNLVEPPEFQCPIPCDYENKLWMYIAIVSLLINCALICVTIPFIIRTEYRDKKGFSRISAAQNRPRRSTLSSAH